MPDIGFYILASRSERDRHLFACKLTEKAYRSGRLCYLLTEDPQQSAMLDDLLWTFRPGSFVPHQLYNGMAPDRANVVLIGHLGVPDDWRDIVINLSTRIPDNWMNSERILEILDDSEESKSPGRIRYQQYRQAGLSVVTHKM
ncbi:MAG: DNA polymerase III subunit chi [Gammaproteobacteria bacterium]|nr:DNA polymerase III subunit chi [Gammaproteobacteria bacterium]